MSHRANTKRGEARAREACEAYRALVHDLSASKRQIYHWYQRYQAVMPYCCADTFTYMLLAPTRIHPQTLRQILPIESYIPGKELLVQAVMYAWLKSPRPPRALAQITHAVAVDAQLFGYAAKHDNPMQYDLQALMVYHAWVAGCVKSLQSYEISETERDRRSLTEQTLGYIHQGIKPQWQQVTESEISK